MPKNNSEDLDAIVIPIVNEIKNNIRINKLKLIS